MGGGGGSRTKTQPERHVVQEKDAFVFEYDIASVYLAFDESTLLQRLDFVINDNGVTTPHLYRHHCTLLRVDVPEFRPDMCLRPRQPDDGFLIFRLSQADKGPIEACGIQRGF